MENLDLNSLFFIPMSFGPNPKYLAVSKSLELIDQYFYTVLFNFYKLEPIVNLHSWIEQASMPKYCNTCCTE